MNKTKKIMLLLLVTLLPLGLIISVIASNLQTSQVPTLDAYKSSSSLNADGVANEASWGSATALVYTTGVTGSAPSTQITLKAVYTTTHIYILASWADTTFSASRDKYLWNGTDFVDIPGSNSEDRLAIMWEITEIAGFNTVGCTTKCHSPTAYLGASELGDIWHLKTARGMGASSATNSTVLQFNATTLEAIGGTINIIGVADDNVIDEVDRGGDAGTSPYRNNKDSINEPAFIEKVPIDWLDAMYLTEAEISGGQAVNRSLITSQEEQWYIANYTALGAVVPKEITSTGGGSRGDISTGATWEDGTWTVEISRLLDTTNNDDVAFDTNGVSYHFSVALMDNSGGDADHSVTPVAILVFPPSAATPDIPGFDLLIFIGSIGAISIIIIKLRLSKRTK